MKEYVEFLASQSPYDTLSVDDLVSLVSRAKVQYFGAGSTIIEAGGPVLDHFWVVRTGTLNVLDRGRIVDQLESGDTFGHILLMSQLPPALTVRAETDSLCLRLPDPRTVLDDPRRLKFTFAGPLVARPRLSRSTIVDRTTQPVRHLMGSLVRSRSDEPISDVAARIGAAAQSCALVEGPQGFGIVTDRDLRERVATGAVSPAAPISDVATFPALTVSEEFSQAAAFARMVDRGVHHLVVVGRSEQPVGVLRAIDFASSDIRSPLTIRSAIETADTMETLRGACGLLYPSVIELADNDVPSLQIGNLLAAVVDAILRKLLTLHNADVAVGAPHEEISWIVLGSMARREPLPHSDVDTAVVWEPPVGTAPAGCGDGRPPSPLDHAAAVLADMQHCGLRPCDDGANASNRLFNRSTEGWEKAATHWLTHPEAPTALLMSSLMIDSRPLTTVTLGRTLTDRMRRSARSAVFIHAFLLEALAVEPPTGFVRDFVVDHTGSHRGQLDLKRGGLRPLVALGRFVAVVTGDSRGSTIDRLRRGASDNVFTRDEADTLVGAFEDVYDLLFQRDIAALVSGAPYSQFIDPKTLDTLTRRHLRESFRVISSVQASVRATWINRLRSWAE